MNTAVIFKWCRNPEDAILGYDGTLNWRSAKFSATDDDHVAMEAARTLSAEENIVALTFDSGKSDWAAARGAGRTLVAKGLSENSSIPERVQALKELINHTGDADVVIIGDSDWEPAMITTLAAQLGRPAFAGVTECERVDDKLHLTCKDGRISRVVEVAAPVFIACKALSKEAVAPSMKQTLAARKKPVETIEVANLDGAIAAVEHVCILQGDESSAVIFDGSNAEQACSMLISALKDVGVLA